MTSLATISLKLCIFALNSYVRVYSTRKVALGYLLLKITLKNKNKNEMKIQTKRFQLQPKLISVSFKIDC